MSLANLTLSFLILLILFLAILLDVVFGELPTKIHPVVFIGKLIDIFNNYLIGIRNILSGIVLTIIVIVITCFLFGLINYIATLNIFLFIIVSSIILSSTFSIKLLLSSANDIKNDLISGIDVARKSMAYLVSRDTTELSEELIISATIETLSENITDSVIAPIFYYCLLAALLVICSTFNTNSIINSITNSITTFITNFITNPIINEFYFIIILLILITIIYRVVNTLDAMVGYKNEKFKFIGYFPAKLDDILNYVPSRFGGIMVVLAAFIANFNWKNSYFIMKRDARKCPSPNSGFTMSAVAGALDISLEKKDVYNIGDDLKHLEKEDIIKAIRLSKISIFLSILVLVLIFLFFVLLSL